MRSSTRALVFVACLAPSGCGDDSGTDASVDATTDAGVEVAAPDIPWLEGSPFDWAECPAGWRVVELGDHRECDPYPEGGPLACGAGEAHFPGEPGCRPLGDPCPAGDLPEGLPSDGTVIWVSATAPAGGDGSAASPFDSLADVSWPSLAAGTTVALGKGTYAATLPLKAGVRLVGACAAETIVAGVDFPAPAVVSVTTGGEAAEVRSLTIANPPQRGASIEAGRALRLVGVRVDGAVEHGVFVSGTGATVELEDVVIEGTRARPGGGTAGRALQVANGAAVDARRVVLERNRDAAIIVGNSGSTVQIADAVIRDTEAQAADRANGRAITVQDAGRASVERVLMTGNRDIALVVYGEGSSASLSETIIRDTRPRELDDDLGRGIELQAGARLEASTVVVAGNRVTGIFMAGAGTTAVLDRVVVRDTESGAFDPRGGRGINVQGGARVEASRLLVADCREVGIFASDTASEVQLDDALVLRTEARALDDGGGRGIGIQAGAQLVAGRLVVAESRDVGIYVSDDESSASITDVVVRDTRPRLDSAHYGRGVQIQNRARLNATRLAVLRSFENGVMSVTGADVTLADLRISEVALAACAPTTCAAAPYGYGLTVGSARLVASRFYIEAAATCGVFVSPDPGVMSDPDVALSSGLVSSSAIGACVQVEGFDYGRLTDGVRYVDNGTNLEATMLPVPEPLAADE